MKRQTNDLGQNIGFPIVDWQPCKHPPKTNMLGNYCRLEPIDISKHGDALYQAYGKDQDQSNWTYLPYGPFKSSDDFSRWLIESCRGDDPQFYAVIDLTTKKAIGIASYLRIEPSVGSIEVGHIHFSPLMQRTAISTEAMYLMMKHIFDELGYRRYEWKCDSLNTPSRNAAKRLGFTEEGVFRQATIYKNRNRDTAWHSILDTEWPALKKMFEAWLCPDNFNESGQQHKSLHTFKT